MVVLHEVFGLPVTDLSEAAVQHRKNKLCPFGNRIASCTKDKVGDPLGVCSIRSGNDVSIVCPVRFRQNGLVFEAAASFFFPNELDWIMLSEVTLRDSFKQVAGRLDYVLCSLSVEGSVSDFGVIEAQSVYVSGNIRSSFRAFMSSGRDEDALRQGASRYRADFLSSSRKRLLPQLLYKGAILRHWGKKQVIVVDTTFFQTLPTVRQVDTMIANVLWIVVDIVSDSDSSTLNSLKIVRLIPAVFEECVSNFTKPALGSSEKFLEELNLRIAKIGAVRRAEL